MYTGVVIGTHGTPAFIELQLAEARKHYPGIPVMVHDDDSPEKEAVKALCEKDGAEFTCSKFHDRRYPTGDAKVYLAGLRWGTALGLDYVVKLSRRFVPRVDMPASLEAVAGQDGAMTYSAPCRHYGFGLRTECMAMSVRQWLPYAEALKDVAGNGCAGPLEHLMHRMTTLSGTYVYWPFLTMSRHTRSDNYLWHDVTTPAEYAAEAASLGVGRPAADFDNVKWW